MSVEHILQAYTGNTDSPLLIHKYRSTVNPISQVYIQKADISNIAHHLQVLIPRGRINIGQALVTVYPQYLKLRTKPFFLMNFQELSFCRPKIAAYEHSFLNIGYLLFAIESFLQTIWSLLFLEEKFKQTTTTEKPDRCKGFWKSRYDPWCIAQRKIKEAVNKLKFG